MKKPSVGATVAKVIVALLFFAAATEVDDDTIAVSLVIGLAFLSWAVLPWRRYKQEIQDAAEGRVSVLKKPGLGAAIVKATFAAIFVIMAFDMEDSGSLIISLVLGAVFLFWTAFPFWKYKQDSQAVECAANPSVSVSEQASKPLGNRLCPYCGAPMVGNICQYCGMSSGSDSDDQE